ncbi:MAG: SemiSWEET family transporter [DPANN group archaeon]|nr:SemiSWEET family transporter [DPANN group archaeon]
MADFVSILAAATTVVGVAMSLSYFVQIAKILKTRSAKDLSLVMFAVFNIGITLWLLYGVAIKNLPIVIVNASSLIGTSLLLGLILKFGKSKD